ncbi:MAG: DNA polymerase II [archaeon GB-1867-005]|nr:DNA polymerase II [Candidatus Culexmicrobium cathedralense]
MRKILTFWPLDVTYAIQDNVPIICFWSITDDGKRVLILDRTFRPYFYVLPKDNSFLESITNNIKKLSSPTAPVLSIQQVNKFFFGKPVTALKVECLLPTALSLLKEKISKISGVKDVLEADIRFYMRYMVDKGVYPCAWHSAEVAPLDNKENIRVDAIYEMKSEPKPIERRDMPDLKILSFDVEYFSPKGSPKAHSDPIVVITVVTNTGEKAQFTLEELDERTLLENFASYIVEVNPDVIVGYNSNRFVWPYILARAKSLNARIPLSREFSEPQTSIYGHISIAGRANVDMLDYAEDLYAIKIKTLGNVADYLNVKPKEEQFLLKPPWVYQYWGDQSRRPDLLKHSMEAAELTLKIAEKALPFAIQLSSVTGIPLDQVLAAPVGFRVEWFLIRQAFKENELIPNRVERPYVPYRGALVLKPIKGLHENIAVIDFSAMYPSLMIKYNISPDTYIPPDESLSPDECFIAPEVGHRFRKSPPGFFKRVLEKLLALRKQIKEQMKLLDIASPEYLILDNRQKAIKVIANACYGYTGWLGARWYVKPCAEATAAFGRETIKEAIDIARRISLRIIYGDTDSLFVKYVPEKVDAFIAEVEREIGLEIKIDKIYEACIFTEAAKRYAGLLQDGRVEVIGFEAVRGDWCELAQEVQLKVIEIILKRRSPSAAAEYVRKVVDDLRSKRVPFEKLIIWKTLAKSLNEYEVDAPHVRVARMLLSAGYSLEVGDKVGFVIIKGTSKRLSDRAKPYFMADYDDLDLDYYVSKQILPSALRVLSVFGFTEDSILKPPSTVTLDFWFKRR